MITNSKSTRSILALALSFLLVCNIFLPTKSYATDYDEIVSAGAVAAGSVNVSANGDIVAKQPISFNLNFKLKTSMNDGTGNVVNLAGGDTLKIKMSDKFVPQAPFNSAVNLNGAQIGNAEFTHEGGAFYIKIAFDSGAIIPANEELDVNAALNLMYVNPDITVPETVNNAFTGSTATFTVEPSQEVDYTFDQVGVLDPKDGTIKWTVNVSATKNGVPVSLSGLKFDSEAGAEKVDGQVSTHFNNYVSGTFKVNEVNQAPTLDGAGQNISYAFEDVTTAKIEYKTKIQHYYAGNVSDKTIEISVTNPPELIKVSDNTVKKTANVTPIIVPVRKWVEKTGAVSDATNKEITWTITINEQEAKLTNVVLTENFTNGQTLKSIKYKIGDEAEQTAPLQNQLNLGNFDRKAIVTVVTGYPVAGAKYGNEANIKYDEWSNLPVTAKAEVDTAAGSGGTNSLKKEFVNRNHREATMEWTLTAGTGVPTGSRVFEIFAYRFDRNTGWNTNLAYSAQEIKNNLPASFPTELKDITQVTFGMKSFSDLTGIQKEDIVIGGKVVGEVVSFPISAGETINYKTQVVDPYLRYKNTETRLTNNAVLATFDPVTNKYVNLFPASATGSYQNGILHKTTINPSALGNITSNADIRALDRQLMENENVYGFDYSDRSVIYRINLNAAGVDFKQLKSIQGPFTNGLLKNEYFVLNEKLPEGLEFVPLYQNGPYYLIYEGTPHHTWTETPIASTNPVSTRFPTGTDLTPYGGQYYFTAKDASHFGWGVSVVKPVGNRSMSFHFAQLDKPYVIFVKAKLTDAEFNNLLDSNSTGWKVDTGASAANANRKYKDFVNGAELVPLDSWGNIEKVISVTKRDDIRPSNITKNVSVDPSTGMLKWKIVFEPYIVSAVADPIEIEDALPQGLIFQKDGTGDPIINITEQTYTRQSDGYYRYQGTTPVSIASLGANMTTETDANGNINKFKIKLPDNAKGYTLEYLTPFTADVPFGRQLTNTFKVTTKDGTTEHVSLATANYIAGQGADIDIWLRKNGGVRVVKVDSATNTRLENAKFKIFKVEADGTQTEFGVEKITDANGEILYALPIGNYILKESVAPSGYSLSSDEYRVEIAQDGLSKKTTIKDSNGVVVGGIEAKFKNTRIAPPPPSSSGGGTAGGGGGGNSTVRPPSSNNNPPANPNTPQNNTGGNTGTPPNNNTSTNNPGNNPSGNPSNSPNQGNNTGGNKGTPSNNNDNPTTKQNNSVNNADNSNNGNVKNNNLGKNTGVAGINENASRDALKNSNKNVGGVKKINSAPDTGGGRTHREIFAVMTYSLTTLILSLVLAKKLSKKEY